MLPLRFTTLLMGLSTLSLACHHQHPPARPLPATAPTSRPATRPVALLNLRDGTGSFPLAGKLSPDSDSTLVASLREGYLARLTSASSDFVTVQGKLPNLKLLRVNVSSARINPEYHPTRLAKGAKTERILAVHRLEYLADPLRYGGASAGIRLVADDATLEQLRDPKNTRSLVFTGARQGQFSLHLPSAEIKNLLATIPHPGHGSHLTILHSSRIAFSSDDPHSLSIDADVRALWILLPTTFSLHGRIDAAPNGAMTFTEFTAKGYDPGGLLAAAFLNPIFREINGHSQPTLLFPDHRTHVTDIRFSTTDGLHFTVDFGQ